MSNYKRNYVIYYYGYFVANLILIYVNVFLPVFFFNILNVNRAELATIQIFSYSGLFLRPIIGFYVEKPFLRLNRKKILIFSAIGTLISFTIFLINITVLTLFGIFLFITFACSSIMGVSIDKYIIELSNIEEIKNKNILCIQLGMLTGSIFPNIIFIIVYSDIYSLSFWNLFFLAGILSTLPLFFIVFLIKVDNEFNERSEELEVQPTSRKLLFIMIIFSFLIYADKLYEYPLEPWILSKYGENFFLIFAFYLIILIILNAISILLAGLFSHKFDKVKVLIFSTLFMGIFLIIAPFVGLIGFIICFIIIQMFAGFVVINMTSLMIDISKKNVMIFQILIAFTILARVIFVPLGTYLSIIISTEFIILISGLLIILSVIPLFFIKTNDIER
ncbi:MAG: hypothetical protein EU535_04795 [Promethearchaeota archaeon]|nr:MAG: hypothetical protein EU535_04795 [Candidatus Lokiarchaeota archaeon]